MSRLRTTMFRRRLPLLTTFLGLLLPALVFAADAAEPLDIAGFRAFSYGNQVKAEPTGRQNESKLWWHDGSWWAVLYNDGAGAYHIYRLDIAAQEWIDTGVAVDDREDTRPDVLWDGQSGKLYVASHVKVENPGPSQTSTAAHLYRYSYDAANRRYQLDGGFPAIVTHDQTETMVLDKDSTGRLWVTYVSREAGSSTYKVYVNATVDVDENWGDPFPLAFPGASVHVDDISSLIAFHDDDGPKIGVLWSNQLDDNFYFATHDDGAAPEDGWEVANLHSYVGDPADDHISMAATPQGELFAVVKAETTQEGHVLIGVLARSPQGSFSFHPSSPTGSTDTRAVLVVHEQQRRVYIFTISKTGGGRVCMSATEIVTPLADMAFPYEDCPTYTLPAAGSALTPFIASTTYANIDDPTTAKHNATYASGILVLASDDVNDKVYVYNHLDTPDPAPGPGPGPEPDNHTLYVPAIRR